MSKNPSGIATNSNTLKNTELFRLLSSEVSEIGRQVGVRIVPFRDPSLPFFSRMGEAHQTAALADLRSYLKVCRTVIASDGDLKDPITLTWNGIKEMNLRPSSDLFNHITDGDIVEIHNPEGIQIFRNFDFYACCSYSLEELYSFSWNYLYTRDPRIIATIVKIATAIYNGSIRNTVVTNLPVHTIEELYSPFKYKILAEVPFISPLFDKQTGKVAATVAIERGGLQGKLLTPSEEEILLNQYYQNHDQGPLFPVLSVLQPKDQEPNA